MARPPVESRTAREPATGLRVRRVITYSRLADQFLADAYEALVPGTVAHSPDETTPDGNAAPDPARPVIPGSTGVGGEDGLPH
jgi:hypothetical protein